MNIDLWSMLREVRHEAWAAVATIGRSFFEALLNMMFSGNIFHAILVIAFIVFFILKSWRLIAKVIVHAEI